MRRASRRTGARLGDDADRLASAVVGRRATLLGPAGVALATRVPHYGLLVAWNLLLVRPVHLSHRGSVDTGYLGLVVNQVKALRYLPHLVSQGAAARMLLFWPLLKLNFKPLPGLVLLAGEAASLLGALLGYCLIRESTAPDAERRDADPGIEELGLESWAPES